MTINPSHALSRFEAIPLRDVRGVLIDLDNTLYPYEPAHQKALRAAYEHTPVAMAWEVFATRYREARDHVTAALKPQGACRSRLLAFQFLCESWGVAAAFQKADELDGIYWGHFLEAMQPDAQALAFLDRCRVYALKICVVSDMTTSIQIRKLAQLGLTNRIDYLVTSEETGAEKPDPRMFTAGLRKLGLRPDEAIMIGDDEAKDVEGAKACGLRAYLVKVEG